MAAIRRPSFLKRQKDQKRLEKANRKRDERRARRDAQREAPLDSSDPTLSSEDTDQAPPSPPLQSPE